MQHECYQWQEYVVNGLEMRGTTVSRATTVVTTTGNSNGFHLDSTHSSIRGRAGEEEEGGRERKKLKDPVV